ncbi:unnamed protein product [Prorocentrum cordatum]|uniref:Uncharacterized protein n=1 Tax=Prorocentrum cordatum TaxID=2364126 RepID=A0ABN9SFV8_9DINO|nr:unnamed protein product [Polarella glacialis]
MPGLQRLLRTLAVKQMNWLCTLPFEMVALWQLLSDGRHGFFATSLLLYRHGGLGMFYRGLRLSLLLAVNPAIMSVVINLKLRVVWWLKISAGPEADREPDIGAGVVGAVAALSKVLTLSLTYPLIRVKVVQQTSPTLQTRRVREILHAVVMAEGFSGLYRGFLPMIYQTLLHNSMMTLLNYQMRPWRISTPPPSPLPEHAAHWLLRKMPRRRGLTPFAREPFPADILVQRMDHIMEQWKDRRERRCSGAGASALKHRACPEAEEHSFVLRTPQKADEQLPGRPEGPARARPGALAGGEEREEPTTIVMLTPQGNVLQGEPMHRSSKADTTPTP